MITEDGFIVVQPVSIYPTKNKINQIKKGLGDGDTFDDEELKKLKEKRSKSGLDKIILAHLFIQCIDNIKNNLNKINLEEKETTIAKKKLEEYLKKVDNNHLRNLIEDYNEGKSHGSYYMGLKIKDIVGENRADMDIVVSIFFAIFGEDDS